MSIGNHKFTNVILRKEKSGFRLNNVIFYLNTLFYYEALSLPVSEVRARSWGTAPYLPESDRYGWMIWTALDGKRASKNAPWCRGARATAFTKRTLPSSARSRPPNQPKKPPREITIISVGKFVNSIFTIFVLNIFLLRSVRREGYRVFRLR